MNSRGVVGAILAATLVFGVLAGYSIRASPPSASTIVSTRTVTTSGSNYTVTVSASPSIILESNYTLTTGGSPTTILAQVGVISATGSQEVLCTSTYIIAPATAEEFITRTTLTIGSSTTVVTVTSISEANTYYQSSVYVSATNSTASAGQVVSAESQASGYSGPGAPFVRQTCTYLP